MDLLSFVFLDIIQVFSFRNLRQHNFCSLPNKFININHESL